MSNPLLTAITMLEDSEYDVDAALFDYRNNNISGIDELERYTHSNIVIESLVNGQFQQAREHCEEHGLNYEQMRVKAGV